VAYLGENIPKLGFGLMRMPIQNGVIDLDRSNEMVDLFLEGGMTYFDTAPMYHGGKSEELIKAAIVDRYPREKFQLATKVAAWYGPKNAEEAKQAIWTSLKLTGAEYFDFYLLHNIGSTRTKYFYDYGLWDYALELKEKGLVKHVGFSFHDKAELLDEVLTRHPDMEFVQLQINYADWECEAIQSRKCYEVARKHNKPVIIMCPVKGGVLNDKLAPEVKSVFDDAGFTAPYSSWAIRFATSLDGIITVLSGMSTLEQIRENISFVNDFPPLTEKERIIVDKAREVLSSLPSVPCTACDYCVSVCPEGVVIPRILDMLNLEMVYKDPESAKGGYMWETKFGAKASDCTACGKCEEACPQHIGIIRLLGEAASKYE